MTILKTRIINTATGDMILGESDGRIVVCSWIDRRNYGAFISRLSKRIGGSIIQCDTPLLIEAERQITEFLGGCRRTFSLPIAVYGTEFQKMVWKEISKIPYGATITYKTLAERVGRPEAVRAVASACGANPLCLIIPCHRVTGSNDMGGFAAAAGVKSQLLRLESPKIVIASDSYKGSLSSEDVAGAMEEGIISQLPYARVIKVPVGDGGEGTANAIARFLPTEKIGIEVKDPLMRRMHAEYHTADNGKLAIIEVASASGLTLLTSTERNPMLTSSYGTGMMIADAMNRGCSSILICLGGSATNDGGTGMLQALGYRFLDSKGKELEGCGKNLTKIVKIDDSGADTRISSTRFIGICDVESPFCGPEGASIVFGPQKGASQEMVIELEAGMRHFAGLTLSSGHREIISLPRSGAAGGIGGAMAAFLDADLREGSETVLEIIGFDRLIEGCSLLITGEGKIDRQTLLGKAPLGILRRGQAKGIPVMAVGGSVSDKSILKDAGFEALLAATPPGMPLALAMTPSIARDNIRNAIASYIADKWQLKNGEAKIEDLAENT